jgi:hypothetical protein
LLCRSLLPMGSKAWLLQASTQTRLCNKLASRMLVASYVVPLWPAWLQHADCCTSCAKAVIWRPDDLAKFPWFEFAADCACVLMFRQTAAWFHTHTTLCWVSHCQVCTFKRKPPSPVLWPALLYAHELLQNSGWCTRHDAPPAVLSAGVGSPLLTSQDLADLFDPVNTAGITPSSVQQLTAALSAGPVPGVLLLLLPLPFDATLADCRRYPLRELAALCPHYCSMVFASSGIQMASRLSSHQYRAGMAPAEAPQQQQPVPQSMAPAAQPTAGQQPVAMPGASQPQMTAAQFLAGLPQQHQVQVTRMVESC